ncbi:hypothetical protein, partial [Glutamicibacter arilaitensis]|uniref:hypothetical protein n=1 Tax=Glutamicibacter arilaitensis TaxID=256701 RepID=UPI003F99C0E2
MPITREAKYLAPVDFGKTITVTNTKTGKTVSGELVRIDAIGCSPIDLTGLLWIFRTVAPHEMMGFT